MYAEQTRQAIINTYRMRELSLDTLMLKSNMGYYLKRSACKIRSTKISQDSKKGEEEEERRGRGRRTKKRAYR